ncbi:MAG TPA: hypothetical protein VIK31_12965 [Propionibacteriaceae bacterium]
MALARDGAGTRDSTRGSMQHRFVIIGHALADPTVDVVIICTPT